MVTTPTALSTHLYIIYEILICAITKKKGEREANEKKKNSKQKIKGEYCVVGILLPMRPSLLDINAEAFNKETHQVYGELKTFSCGCVCK